MAAESGSALLDEFALTPEEWDIVLDIAKEEYTAITPEVVYYVATEYIIGRERYDRNDFTIDYQNFATYVLFMLSPSGIQREHLVLR